jgi:hypothetical protein
LWWLPDGRGEVRGHDVDQGVTEPAVDADQDTVLTLVQGRHHADGMMKASLEGVSGKGAQAVNRAKKTLVHPCKTGVPADS